METKEKRTKVVATVLALAGLLLVWTLATAGNLEPSGPPSSTMKTLDEVEPRIPIHASDLPLTIMEPGSYYLVEDVNFTDIGNHAITIESDDVTIDLMGYSLAGPNSTSNSGIYINGRENIEIRNGTICDFYSGIYEASSGIGHRVIGMRLISNSLYGIRLNGSCHLVKDCISNDNGNTGISLGSGGILTGSTAYNNGYYGIITSTSCTVTGNAAYYNKGNGISVGPGSTVIGNTACNNNYHGIYTNAYCTVTDNTVYSNGSYGIDAGSGSTITNNTVDDNGGRGIYVNSYGTVSGNTVNHNQSFGIYAGSYSAVSNNVLRDNNISDAANASGIYVSSDCMVKGNTLSANRQNNILVYNSDNVIEENLVTDCTGNGISFNTSGNFYANNRASGNGTNYNNGVVQTDGGGNYSF